MAFALQRRGVTYSRHNWSNEIQTLLKWIEENRVTGMLDMNDPLNKGQILVEGCLDLQDINRMRKILGWTDLAAETAEPENA